MAKEIKGGTLLIDADTKGVKKGFQTATKETKNFEKNLKSTGNAAKNTSLTIAGLSNKIKALSVANVAIAGLVTGLVALTKSSLSAADAIGKAADSAQVSTDFFQQLQFAAEQSGVSFEGAKKALQVFSKQIGEAALGTGLLKKQADILGIALKNNEGRLKSTESLFIEFAEAIKSIEDPAIRAKVAADAFGRSGVELLPLLQNGAAGFEELASQAEALGLVIDEKLIRQSEAANDAINRLTSGLEKGLQKVLISVAPLISDVADRLNFLVSGAGAVENIDFLNEKLREVELKLKDIKEIPELIKLRIGVVEDVTKVEEERLDILKALARLGDKNARQEIANLAKIGNETAKQLNEQIKLKEKAAKKSISINAQDIDLQKKKDLILKEQFKTLNKISSTVSQNLLSLIKGTQTLSNAFSNVLDQIANIILQKSVIDPIVGQLFGKTSSLGSLITSGFAGFFADGGIIPAGKSGIVGEAGAELVRGPATVTPLDDSSMGGVTNIYNFNGSVSAADKQNIINEIQKTLPGSINNLKRRGQI